MSVAVIDDPKAIILRITMYIGINDYLLNHQVIALFHHYNRMIRWSSTLCITMYIGINDNLLTVQCCYVRSIRKDDPMVFYPVYFYVHGD